MKWQEGHNYDKIKSYTCRATHRGRTIIPRVCTDYSQNLSPDTPSKASKNQRSEWERGLLKQGGILGFLKSLRDRDLTAPSAPVHPWPVDQPGGFLSKTSVFLTIKIDTKAWFQ